MNNNRLIAAVATALFTLAASPVGHAEAILPGGISSHLPEAEQRQIIEDPLGAALNQTSSAAWGSAHSQMGAAAFASFYSTGYLSPAWQYSGPAADAARCADTLTLSTDISYLRFLAAMACIVPNPRLAGALDAQFRATGHF